MSSIATENVKLGDEARAQAAREREIQLSGEQEATYRRSAIDILKQLQIVLKEGELPGTEAISDLLLKTEEILVRQAQLPNLEPETRKVLEDIAQLVGSAKQLARHKDLGDRLQRITEETKKAMEKVGHSDMPAASREATKQALDFVQTWRPLFNILMSAREFRILIVDVLKIFREVFLRHQEGIGNVEEKFVEGKHPVDIAKEYTEEVSSTFKTSEGNVKFEITDDEWDRLYDDITRCIVLIAQHPTYHDGIDHMFSLLQISREHIHTTRSSKEAAIAETHARRARLETEELLASFAGRETIDHFYSSLTNLVNKVEKDEQTRQYLSELREFLLNKQTAENIHQDEYKSKIRDLARRGRHLVEEYRYADEVNQFLNASDELIENIRNDEFVSVLRHHAGIVASDISYVDTEGNVQPDMETLGKLRTVLVPILAESLKYIPVPRIEGSDPYRDFWVDNIVLCGYDIIPENIRLQIESDSQLSLKELETQRADTRLVITLGKIRTELKDMDFYYKRKSFPELKEQGRVTLRLGGEGATLKMVFKVIQGPTDKVPKFAEGLAYFNIHKMDIEFDKSSLTHDILVPMMTGLFKMQIQRQIEVEVEKNLSDLIHNIGERLTESLAEVNRPFMSGLDTFRDVVKSTEIAHTYQKRREKLE